MGITRAAIGLLMRHVRRDAEYILDPGLDTRDLLLEFMTRGTSLLRAQWSLRGTGGGRLRFVESGVRIRHRRYLHVGAGSVLESHSYLQCLGRTGIRIGDRVTVGKFAIIECTSVLWHQGEGLIVGNDSSIGDYSFIGCAGGIRIGERVLMGQRVSFHSQNHHYADADVDIRRQGISEEGIMVGDDCWLGSGSIILDGVVLGDGSVVAAGAVVTRSFPKLSVVAGVPARLVRVRGLGETHSRATNEPPPPATL